MPKSSKVNACLIVVVTIVFYVFWELRKQVPALAQVATTLFTTSLSWRG